MKYGVWQARRGWLEKKDVVNTLGYEEFKKAIQR
jgi:DNA polymerase (family 10)